MRFAALILTFSTVALAQQSLSLVQFLGLTAAQTVQIQQLNTTLDKANSDKQNRLGVLYSEVSSENAKTSPDALALGQRYLEIDSINRSIRAASASTQAAVAALLSPGQKQLLQQISDALVQSSLVTDAGCAFLANDLSAAPPVFQSSFTFSSVLGSGTLTGTALGGILGYYPCSSTFPISIRNYLALTDAQVAGILALQSGYYAFSVQKNYRVADVQVELRDELAKPVLDPLALGTRYIELTEISREVTAAGATAQSGATALLTSSQQMKLQSLLNTSSLVPYQFVAVNCRLLSAPPGSASSTFSFYTPGFSSCQLN